MRKREFIKFCSWANYRHAMPLLLILLGISLKSQSQDTLRVSVRANVKKDVIQLRWGVNSPLAWKQTNRYGYRIERYTVVRNKEVLPQPEKIVLSEVLKPQPLNNWQTLATSNNLAAVIAQALYGEEFQLTGDDTKGVSKFIALAQEMEQRYLVSMYAADLCFPGALLAGWGFEDRTVKPGERYLYRIIPLVPSTTLKIDPGSVYVTLSDYQELPKPQELSAVFGDMTVLLTWNYGILKHVYNSYHIEKSYDGTTFSRVSEIPLTNMNSKDGKPADRMYYIDSLKNNSIPAHYRAVGVTAFSEEGPPSEVIHGSGKSRLIYVPHIQRAIPDATGGVNVDWEFDERGNGLIKSFELLRGDTDKGPFVPVVKNILPAGRTAFYDSLMPSNYFVIAAIPENGESVVSFPVLVQPVDSIPPSVPAGLKGVVDTLGIVRLAWNQNREKDLLGYRIYRAQNKTEELIPLNDVAVRSNQFIDTLDVRNLNSKVYYAVVAVDMRYNQSAKSETTELQKPDLVPPSSPVITHYKITSSGVFLEWVTGGEDNIKSINIWRKDKNAKENKLIKSLPDTSHTYIDETTEADKFYQYSITAATSGGLSSQPSPVVMVQVLTRAGEAGTIVSFVAKVNKKTNQVELSWKHTLKSVKEFQLFKGESGKSPSLWKVLKGFESKIQDNGIVADKTYEYIIKATLENGKNGGVAKTSISIGQ